MRSGAWLAALAGGLLFVSTVVPAQTTPSGAQGGQPTFGTSTELVMVDVTVTGRNGDPVLTLGPDDFSLTVDGLPRKILSMRLLRGIEMSGITLPNTVAAQIGRRFVLVVDRDHIPAGEGQQAMAAATRFIDKRVPGDQVALWVLPARKEKLQFIQGRETMKAELKRSLGTYRPPMVDGVAGRAQFNIAVEEAVQIEDGNSLTLGEVISRECPDPVPDSPRGDPCPAQIPIAARQIALEARQRAQATLMALTDLVRLLSQEEGPKHVVLITGGPLASREELPLVQMLSAQAAQARVTFHALQVPFGQYQARTDQMRPMPKQPDQERTSSYFLAGLTGGLALTPPAAEVAFERLDRELSAGYLLAFEALPSDRNGQVHKIAVEVKYREFGGTLRARQTFVIDRFASTRAMDAAALEMRLAQQQAEASDASAPRRVPDPVPAVEPVSEPAPVPATSAPAAPAAPGAAAASAAPAGGSPSPELAGLTAGLADYVDRFERDFVAVVARERYVQMVHPWRGNPKGPEHEPELGWRDGVGEQKQAGSTIARRQLLSDVLLVQVKGGEWMGFRDVEMVDGSPVRDRGDRVRELFLSERADKGAQLRRIADESARYNLGDFRRTMNLPNVALSFMRRVDQGRYEFKRLADDEVNGRSARVVSYVEKVRPTLIRTPNGRDIPIYGRIWLDAEHGRVVRTELRFDRGGEARAAIRVDFRQEPGLDILVPARMWEWYEGGNVFGRIGADKTLVQCLAEYSEYKRFQVATEETVK
jgi:VWFA-related protein